MTIREAPISSCNQLRKKKKIQIGRRGISVFIKIA